VRKNRSLVALITFCATTSLIVALGMAILFASASLTFAVAREISSPAGASAAIGADAVNELAKQSSTEVQAQTFNGLVTDDHCGARHDMGSDKSPAECARACVRNGAKYALVDGDKSYGLEGNTEDIGRVFGLRVTLLGSLRGNTIEVSSIASGQ
jgi:hypothetical protein